RRGPRDGRPSWPVRRRRSPAPRQCPPGPAGGSGPAPAGRARRRGGDGPGAQPSAPAPPALGAAFLAADRLAGAFFGAAFFPAAFRVADVDVDAFGAGVAPGTRSAALRTGPVAAPMSDASRASALSRSSLLTS